MTEPFELWSRPRLSTRWKLLRPILAKVLIGVAVAAAGPFVLPVESTVGATLVGIGVLVVVSGLDDVRRKRLVLWRQVILRLTADGLELHRHPEWVRLPWSDVAALHLGGMHATLADGTEHDWVVVQWVPVDDELVPLGPTSAFEKELPYAERRARLVSVLTNPDARDERLGKLLAWVREHRPELPVLDTALGTTPTLEAPDGPRVAVLSRSRYGASLNYHLLPALVASGRRPVGVTRHVRNVRPRAVLGADARLVEDDLVPTIVAAVADCEAFIVIGREIPEDPDDAPAELCAALSEAYGDRPLIVVDDRREGLDVFGTRATVLVPARLTERVPVGRVSVTDLDPDAPVRPAAALPAGDLAALVLAALDAPAPGRVLAVSAGDVPVAEVFVR